MKSIKKIIKSLFSNKKTFLIILFFLVGGVYLIFFVFAKEEVNTKYSTETIERTTITNSITGNGQVSASNQVDVKFKSSGDVVYIGAVNGQEVKSGTLIISLDSTDVQKSIRDAEINLESAQLNLEETLTPVSDLDLMQAENSLSQAKENKISVENDLDEVYEQAFNSVSDTFLDLPSVVVGLQGVLFSDDLTKNGQWNVSYYGDSISSYNDQSKNMSDLAYDTYIRSEEIYDINFENYKNINRYSSREEIEELLVETYNTTKVLSDAIKNTNNLIQLYQDEYTERNLEPEQMSDNHLGSLGTYTGTINNVLTELLSLKNSIKNLQEDIINAERDIEEKNEIYQELIDGADEYNIKLAELSVKQKENALLDAKEELYNYYVYAPFGGTIAEIDISKGETVSSNNIAFTLITNQKIAEIILNEIEIADIKIGQKVNLKFDAADDLLIQGEVSEVDIIGTVNSGVVNYGVKINFETDDKRIKPGMSVNAEIILEEKTDVFVVPNSAIDYVKNEVFVQVLEKDGSVIRIPVVVGLMTDLETEIVEGVTRSMNVIVGQNNVIDTERSNNTERREAGGNKSSNMDVMKIMR